MRLDGLLDLVEVAQPELVEGVVLVGPAAAAVGLAVGQAGLAEAAVAAGRVLGDAVGLDEQHRPAGVALDRAQRRPEPREPATHDQQVDVDVTRERGTGVGAEGAVEPQRAQHGAGQRLLGVGGGHGQIEAHRAPPPLPRSG